MFFCTLDFLRIAIPIVSISLNVLVYAPDFLRAQDNDKRWLSESDSLFTRKESEHFQIYYIKSSLDEKTIDDILRSKESGYVAISKFFDLDVPTRTMLYLFPNEELKYKVTGHRGYGWGFDGVIVEVYNDSIKVDPYHELVHVIGNRIGQPPAMVDEGLAVYLSEKLGSCSFFDLAGYPGGKINETLAILLKDRQLIPWSVLFSYDDISKASDVILAYVESASFVKYLIENYGQKRFLELFSATKAGNSVEANSDAFFRIYKMKLVEAEEKWLVWLSP